MTKTITLILFVVVTCIPFTIAQTDHQIILGTKHTIFSDTLNEERSYWISLPESYHQEDSQYKTYPVLVLLDGHAHFRSISGLVNYMSSGYNGNRKIPEMIIVGIQNVNRRRDFTPDKIITRRANVSGGGESFLSFLEDELLPSIDKEYRTTSYKILYGHSLGGLLATHTYMKDHTAFNAFIAVDPSFGTWDSETMDQKLDSISSAPFDRYLYIATANWGKRNFKNRNRHVRLFEALNSKCAKTFPAELEYFENENHGSVPAIAFHNGISSIFKGYGISYRDVDNNEQLITHFNALSSRLSYDFHPPEALVNRIGYAKLRSQADADRSEALALFKLNTELYSDSYNAFDSLGEAYERLGDSINAVKNYKESLKLNPKNAHAIEKIEKLEMNK